MLRMFGLAALAATCFASASFASDLPQYPRLERRAPAYVPAAPVYNWSGMYIGINGGGGWLSASQSPDQGLGAISGTNWNVGGQAGFNYQFGKIVFGIETDVDYYFGEGVRTTDLFVGAGIPDQFTHKVNWTATLRPRLGFAIDNFLLYGTGGVALGSITTTERIDFTGVGGTVSTTKVDETRVGSVVGVGLEYAFADNWTAKVEYLHFDFGGQKTTGNFFVQESQTTMDQVRGGINYKF